MASDPATQKRFDEVGPKLKATLAALCSTDAWSEAVVSCFTGGSEISKCKDGLTREQRARYTQETMKVMTNGRIDRKPLGGSAAATEPAGSATPPK